MSFREAYKRRCGAAIDLALDSVPAYGSWRRFDSGGGNPFTRLIGLPLVDKALMRQFGPEGFVPEGLDLKASLAKGEVEIVNTSGSTGDRVSNIWCQSWWDASERSSWKLNAHAESACTGLHREAILSSPLCVGFPSEDSYLSKESRSLGRFLFLNERIDPSHWTEDHMRRMVKELDEVRPATIEANPSYLARLSRFIVKSGLKTHKPSLIVFTYENPSLLHLRQIDAAFGAPMASSYGSTETGYVFMQCECGLYHQNSEHCHVDFIPFSERHGGPLTGSLLVTTLDNPWRSLLRFDIGDVVKLSKTPCKCGRHGGLTLKSIEGRAVNLTIAPNGHAITQASLDRAMASVSGLEEYQLLQTGKDVYRILFSHGSHFAETSLLHALEDVYGAEAKFELEKVAGLPPDPPGKYRLAKPLIDIDPRAFWDPAFAPPERI